MRSASLCFQTTVDVLEFGGEGQVSSFSVLPSRTRNLTPRLAGRACVLLSSELFTKAPRARGAGSLLCSIAMLAVLRSWMGPSTSQAPTIVEGSADAAIVRALEATTPNPIITISQLARVLRAIFVLKRWARATTGAQKRRKGHAAKIGAAVTVLKQRLSYYGLHMLQVGGDGNCQFRSASQQLFGTEAHHGYVRQQAVEYMRSHKALFSGFCADAVEFERYLARMARDRMWGDELTLRAISDR